MQRQLTGRAAAGASHHHPPRQSVPLLLPGRRPLQQRCQHHHPARSRGAAAAAGQRPRQVACRASNDNNTAGDADAASDSSDLWAPVPPTPALGRKRKVAVLIGAALLEISLTGALVWSPLLCAVALAVLQPTKAEIEQQQDEAVKQAVAAAEVQAYRHLPVTPVESVAWMNRLNQDMWATFWQPFLLSNNLDSWQDTVSAAAPRGWEVEIADVSIGTLAPQMSGFQAFADPDTGAVTAVDADMSFNSSSVRVVVVGCGPLGAFTAKVSAVQMEGHMRITPLLQHRMLLVAFKQSPAVRVSLSLSAPLFKTALSPGDLGQLNFIQGLIGSAIKDQLVEPRRMAISLDSEIRVEQAVSTTLHLTLDSITGLPRAVFTAESGGSGRSTASLPAPNKVALVLVDTTTQVRRASRAVSPMPGRRAAQLQQSLSLELRRKQGTFRLEVREVTQGPGGRVSASKGQLLGSCLLWVAAARDGTTLFWTHDRSGSPLATRWSPASNRPWQVTLPLTPEVPGAQALQVSLGVAVSPWSYKAGVSPGLPGAHSRSPGPRVVVVQVVEARGLRVSAVRGSNSSSSSSQGPTTHVQLAYGQDIHRTSTQYGTTSPIFNEVIAFEEAPGIMQHRVKLEVWQDDISLEDVEAAAAAAAAGSGSSSPRGGKASRRVLVPSSRRTGFKPVNRLRHSSGSSSSSITKARSNGSSNGSNGSSSLASYQLPDVEPESDSADPDSHMLIDLEMLQEEEEQELADSSSSSSAASLGSTFIELDQLTETLVQDRWFELSGVEGGEVRLRLAVVPGTLPAAGSSSSKRRQRQRQQQPLSAAAADEVSQMLSFFYKQLQRSSRDSIMVEVVSARLYLPLSSMDSSDLDQPAYVLSYGGRSTVTIPPYARPSRSRPASRTSSSSSGSGSSSSLTRPSSGASRAPASSSSGRASSADPRGGGSSGGGGGAGGGALDSLPTSSMFEEVSAGNISQQLVEETCLARAVFPLHPDSAPVTAAAGRPSAGSSAAGRGDAAAAAGSGSSSSAAVQGSLLPAAAAAPPRLKVLLFDPEDLAQASPVDAAAAIATAAAVSRLRAATTPGTAAAGAGSGPVSSVAPASPASRPITLTSSSSGSSSSSLSDMGGVELDVLKLLTAARQGRVAAGAAGAAAIAAEAGAESGGAVAPSAAAAAACWEGWVKLDKDGGHLLLRVTQLSAAEAADIVAPTTTGSSSSSTGAGEGSSSGASSSASKRVAAAAAAVAGPSGASSGSGSGAAGGLSSSASSVEEEVEGLQDKLLAALKQGVSDAQGQVVGAVNQLTDATVAATRWVNSTTSWAGSSTQSWLTPWRSSSSTSSSNGASKSKKQPQQQKPAAGDGDSDAAGSASTSQQQQAQQAGTAEGAGAQAPSSSTGSSSGNGAGPAAASGAAVLRAAEQSMRQQKQRQQGEPASAFALDLRFISRALGLAGPAPGSSTSGKQRQQQGQQQQQQLQPPAAGPTSQQEADDVRSHLLPRHVLDQGAASVESVASLDEPHGTQLGAPAAAAAVDGANSTSNSNASSSSGDGSSQGADTMAAAAANSVEQELTASSPAASGGAGAAANGSQASKQQTTQQQQPALGAGTTAAAAAAAAAAAGGVDIRSHPVPDAAVAAAVDKEQEQEEEF